MLVAYPVCYFYLLPNDFINFSKTIIYSLGFISNYFFYFTGLEYGIENNVTNLFHHNWSLSVEEQFYIIFPILVLFLNRYLPTKIGYSFIFLLLMSLIFAQILRFTNPSLNFYLIFTRFWELLTGSILAYFEFKKYKYKYKFINYNSFSLLGFIFIFFSIFFFEEELNHPSVNTLLVIVGTSLIIYFSESDNLAYKILSNKIFVSIGLISYSLYLWHYPILSLDEIINFSENDILKKIFLIFVIILLSIFTYFFIEKPFRKKNNSNKKIIFIFIFSILLFLINFFTIINDGYKNRKFIPEFLKSDFQNLYYRGLSQNNLNCHNRLGNKGFCIYNQKKNNDGDIVLLGDSISDSLLKNFSEKIIDTNFRLISLSYSGQLYIPEYTRYRIASKKIISDEKYHDFRSEYLEKEINKNSYLVIIGAYSHVFESKALGMVNDNIENIPYVDLFSKRKNIIKDYEYRKKEIIKDFQKTIENLSKKHKILLVYPIPESPVHVARYLKSKIKKSDEIKSTNFYRKDKINYNSSLYEKYFSNTLNLFDKIDNKNIFKIKTKSIFCPKEKCFMYDNKNINIWDTLHPTYFTSNKINNLILDKIKLIESQRN
jgi:peptidoglycan/LPS O-acetylase OafA/YrhL